MEVSELGSTPELLAEPLIHVDNFHPALRLAARYTRSVVPRPCVYLAQRIQRVVPCTGLEWTSVSPRRSSHPQLPAPAARPVHHPGRPASQLTTHSSRLCVCVLLPLRTVGKREGKDFCTRNLELILFVVATPYLLSRRRLPVAVLP